MVCPEGGGGGGGTELKTRQMQTRGNALHSQAGVHLYSLCQTWLNLKAHTMSETETRTSCLTVCPERGGGGLCWHPLFTQVLLTKGQLVERTGSCASSCTPIPCTSPSLQGVVAPTVGG